MEWMLPPRIKIYEALGSIGDNRIEIEGNGASVHSSDHSKTYTVKYDPEQHAITANDNGSYWQGYMGYPIIAYLMLTSRVTYDPRWATALCGFSWKLLNTTHKNDFAKVEQIIRAEVVLRGYDLEGLDAEIVAIETQLRELHLERLKPGIRPLKD
jgi:hypothetical protein